MANLINDQAGLKSNIAAIDANFSWPSIKSFVEDVERDVIGEAIGEGALLYFTGNLTTLQGTQAKVLQILQRAEAYLAVHRWTQTALYRFTDKALYVAKSSEGVIISDKKLRDLRLFCEETGFNFLDKAIGLMETNLQLFPAYADSSTRQSLMQGFIATAADFNLQRSIDNSRLTFLSMHAIMLDVQEDFLPDVMGDAFYQGFKERFLDNDLSVDEKKLLPYIKKGVAFITIAKACNQLPIKIGAKGLLINKYIDSKEFEQQDAAEAARIDYLSEENMEKGRRKLLELQNYLVKNSTLYPGYVAPVENPVTINEQDSGFYIL